MPAANVVPDGPQLTEGTVLGRRALETGFLFALLLYLAPFTIAGPLTRFIAGIAVGAVFVALASWWLARRSAGQRSHVLAFALLPLALAGFVLADSITSVGLVWVAVLILSYEGFERVAYGVAVVFALVTGVAHTANGSPWGVVLGEAAATLFVVGLGVYLATTLKRMTVAEQQRERALAELEVANRELKRRLATEQDLVVAEERARVAAALHDGLGHRLTAIAMSLDFGDRMLARDPERARSEIRAARAATSDTLDEMRRVVRAMHPVVTDPGDPVGSVQAIAESFHSTGLDVRFFREGDARPDDERGLLMVRFAQEALTNVVRHSGATTVHVRVQSEPGRVVVVIDDDGCGGEMTGGYGIPSLRERAAALGGDVIASPRGGLDGGFRLTLHLPEVAT